MPASRTPNNRFPGIPVILGCLAFAVFCLMGLLRLRVGENAAAMLPDKGTVARDFALLQHAPFAQRLLVTLEDSNEFGPDRLTDAAKNLADKLNALGAPLITSAFAGPPVDKGAGIDLLNLFFDDLPRFVEQPDLDAMEERLGGDEVRLRMLRARNQLLGPQGFVMEKLLLRDPLDLRDFGLARLRHVNLLPRMRLHNGAFLSTDRLHALVVAATDVPMTDVAGAERLVSRIREIIQQTLPRGVRADLLCGHRYTLANAGAIKKDIRFILGVSIVGLALLFFLLVRTWRIVFVLLSPALAYLGGAAFIALLPAFPVVSGVTLGFGGVLMGICVDFSLHVFMALRRAAPNNKRQALAEIRRPVLFSYLTTAAAFSLMLLSDLPGVRQLGVFALAGLTTALISALYLLPLLPLGRERSAPLSGLLPHAPSIGSARLRNLGLWLVLILVCAVAARNLHLEGDIRQLALTPPELKTIEQEFKDTWGDVRGQAMVFSPGKDLDQALQMNNTVFQTMTASLPPEQAKGVLSIAPILPSRQAQNASLELWREFWKDRITPLRREFANTAQELGFAANAFDPFFLFLEQSATSDTPFVTPESLRNVGLAPLLDILLPTAQKPGNDRLVLTMAADTPELRAMFPEQGTSDISNMPHLVSQTRFREELGQALELDFTRFMLLAGGMVLLLVFILFRRPGRSLAALAPVLTALAVLAGGMALISGGLNIYGVLAAVLSVGLAVDYGIFMAWQPLHRMDHGVERAVTLSALSTILGFGVLALASHPALRTMGLAVLLGLTGALPAALFVTPALQGRMDRKKKME